MTRPVSWRLRRLPQHLALEFALYSSGNRNAGVLAKLKAIWRDDTLVGRGRARIVIFVNTRARAGEMGAHLSERGVPNIVATGQGIKGQSNKRGRYDGDRSRVERGPDTTSWGVHTIRRLHVRWGLCDIQGK